MLLFSHIQYSHTHTRSLSHQLGVAETKLTLPFPVGNLVFFERWVVTREMKSGRTKVATKKISTVGANVAEVVVHVNRLDTSIANE